MGRPTPRLSREFCPQRRANVQALVDAEAGPAEAGEAV